MASEYDSLLEEAPQSSEYDALLAPEPQESSGVGEIAGNIGRAAWETVKGFVPTSLEQARDLAVSLVPPLQAAKSTYGTLSAIVHGESPLEPITHGVPVAQRIPEIAAAEKTAPYSQERFQAGFGTLADVAMLAGIGHGVAKGVPKTIREVVKGVEEPITPEVAPVEPQPMPAVEPVVAEPIAQPVPEAVAPVTAEPIQESVLGKQEPISPTTAAGTGEAIHETTKTEPNVVPSVSGGETPVTERLEAAKAKMLETINRRKLEGQDFGIPEGMIEEGLNTQYPEVAEALQTYTIGNRPSGIRDAMSHPEYGEYKSQLEILLRKSYGNKPIPVIRIEGYAGGTGQGAGDFISVSTNPFWGREAIKKGNKVIQGAVDPRDVVAAGGEAEGELIVKKGGFMKLSEVPMEPSEQFVKGGMTAREIPKTAKATEVAEPTVSGAAIRLKDGTIVREINHPFALREAYAKGYDINQAEHGFVLSNGEFVSGTEAWKKSKAASVQEAPLRQQGETTEARQGIEEGAQAPEDVVEPAPATPVLEVTEPTTAAPLPQKPSKIGQSIEAKAVEAKLTKGFAETAGYDPLTIADQSQRATDLIKASVPQARAIIRGEAPLPEGLRGTSVITAMEEHLLKNPDARAAFELANSPLTSATSAAAQEMRLMRERVPDSLAAKFQEIREARQAGAKLRGEVPETVYADITKEVMKQASKRPTWEAFVREIVC